MCGNGVERFYSTHVPNAYGVISGACGNLVTTGNNMNFFLELGIGIEFTDPFGEKAVANID